MRTATPNPTMCAADRACTTARAPGAVDADGAATHDNAACLARMREREAQRRERDIASGALLVSADICARLGVTRQALSLAVRGGRAFALDHPSHRRLYPAFLADPAIERAHMDAVVRALGDLPGSTKYLFFTTRKLSLAGRTPLDALASGADPDAVLCAARRFRQR